MATNYVNEGDSIVYSNPSSGSDIESGDVVVLEDMLGVALVDIDAGEKGTVKIEGVFDLPMTASQAVELGEKIHWDTSAKKFINQAAPTAAGDVENCAVAMEKLASAAGTKTVRVKLVPGIGAEK